MTKQTDPITGTKEEFVSMYEADIKAKAEGSKTKYGFVQKPGFKIPMLTAARLSAQTGISLKKLERMRQTGKGPKGFKVGRKWHYMIVDVEAWIDELKDASEGSD